MDLDEVIFSLLTGEIEFYVKEEPVATDKKIGDVSQQEAQMLSLYLKMRKSKDIYNEQMSVRIYELLVVGVAKRFGVDPDQWENIRFRMDQHSKNVQIVVLASGN